MNKAWEEAMRSNAAQWTREDLQRIRAVREFVFGGQAQNWADGSDCIARLLPYDQPGGKDKGDHAPKA